MRYIHVRCEPIYKPLTETDEPILTRVSERELTGPVTVKMMFNKEMPIGIVSSMRPRD